MLKKMSSDGGVLSIPAHPTFSRDGDGVTVLIINNSKKPNTLRDHLPGPVLSALHMCICPHSYPRGYNFHCEGEGREAQRGSIHNGQLVC